MPTTVVSNYALPKQSAHISFGVTKRQDPAFTQNGLPVSVVEESEFLGIIFDCKLSFIAHIRHVKEEYSKALNNAEQK